MTAAYRIVNVEWHAILHLLSRTCSNSGVVSVVLRFFLSVTAFQICTLMTVQVQLRKYTDSAEEWGDLRKFVVNNPLQARLIYERSKKKKQNNRDIFKVIFHQMGQPFYNIVEKCFM